MPSASAQAQLPPPNYSFTCESQAYIDVDPETAKPPTDTIECIYNQESYAIEVALQSTAGGLETSLSVDKITVGGNTEEFFEVTITGEDGMMMSAFSMRTVSEVRKTGELDYSDDEPQEVNGIVQILQYAGFKVEQHRDYNLADGESIELGYSVTNLGNYRDRFFIGLYSKPQNSVM